MMCCTVYEAFPAHACGMKAGPSWMVKFLIIQPPCCGPRIELLFSVLVLVEDRKYHEVWDAESTGLGGAFSGPIAGTS